MKVISNTEDTQFQPLTKKENSSSIRLFVTFPIVLFIKLHSIKTNSMKKYVKCSLTVDGSHDKFSRIE